jgi:hypothetical protein
MYFYTVVYIDEDYIEQTETGIVSGNSYGAAADKVADFYKADNIMNIKLEHMMMLFPPKKSPL